MKKEYEGLRVSDLRDLNINLSGSWIKRYNLDKSKFCTKIIEYKYRTCKPNIFASLLVMLLISGKE